MLILALLGGTGQPEERLPFVCTRCLCPDPRLCSAAGRGCMSAWAWPLGRRSNPLTPLEAPFLPSSLPPSLPLSCSGEPIVMCPMLPVHCLRRVD